MIAYAEESKDWIKCLEILDAAWSYAVSEEIRERFANNRSTVVNNQSLSLISKYLDPLMEKIHEIDITHSITDKMSAVKSNILPHLSDIKKLSDMSEDVYEKCADAVARYVRDLSLSEYNDHNNLPVALRFLEVSISVARGRELRKQLQEDKAHLVNVRTEGTGLKRVTDKNEIISPPEHDNVNLGIFILAIIFSIFIMVLLSKIPDSLIPRLNGIPLIEMQKEKWPLYCVYVVLLSLITIYEIKYMRILDIFTLPGILLGILLTSIFNFSNLFSHIIGIFIISVPLYFGGVIYAYKTDREGIGGGVIKLTAMIGAFLGSTKILMCFLIGFVILVPYLLFNSIRLRTSSIEVGPIISVSGLLCMFIPVDKLFSQFLYML